MSTKKEYYVTITGQGEIEYLREAFQLFLNKFKKSGTELVIEDSTEVEEKFYEDGYIDVEIVEIAQ